MNGWNAGWLRHQTPVHWCVHSSIICSLEIFTECLVRIPFCPSALQSLGQIFDIPCLLVSRIFHTFFRLPGTLILVHSCSLLRLQFKFSAFRATSTDTPASTPSQIKAECPKPTLKAPGLFISLVPVDPTKL